MGFFLGFNPIWSFQPRGPFSKAAQVAVIPILCPSQATEWIFFLLFPHLGVQMEALLPSESAEWGELCAPQQQQQGFWGAAEQTELISEQTAPLAGAEQCLGTGWAVCLVGGFLRSVCPVREE